MRSKLTASLVIFAIFGVTSPAFAKHEADDNFPWVQTQSLRGQKAQQRDNGHWGKHHHHGIILEGADHDRAPAPAYD